MENTNFKSTTRRHKAIAVSATILFHVVLFGVLSGGTSSVNFEDMVPQKVKQWLDQGKDDTTKKLPEKRA